MGLGVKARTKYRAGLVIFLACCIYLMAPQMLYFGLGGSWHNEWHSYVAVLQFCMGGILITWRLALYKQAQDYDFWANQDDKCECGHARLSHSEHLGESLPCIHAETPPEWASHCDCEGFEQRPPWWIRLGRNVIR